MRQNGPVNFNSTNKTGSGGKPAACFLKFNGAQSIALAAFSTPITAFTATIAARSATGAATPPGRTFFPRTGDIYRNRTTLKVFIVKLVDSLLSLFRRGKLHEGKSTRFARDLVHHQVDGGECSNLCKMILKIILPGLVGEVPNE
jgi:hypothetical protein